MGEHAIIQQRAYAIWEAEGRPEARDEEFWYRAEKQLLDEDLVPGTEDSSLSDAEQTKEQRADR